MLLGRKPQITAHKGKNFTLLFTPEGKKLAPSIKKTLSSISDDVAGNIHKKTIHGRFLPQAAKLSHKHEFMSAVKQSAISEHIPRPYALLLREKNRAYFWNEKFNGKVWGGFSFRNNYEKNNIFSAIFNEADKLAKNGLLPIDFRPWNMLLKRTQKGIDFRFIDTSVKPRDIGMLNAYLVRANMPPLPESTPIRRAQRWYLRLPLKSRIRIQEAIIKFAHAKWEEYATWA